MTYYIIIIILGLISFKLNGNRKAINQKAFGFFCFACILAIGGLRNEVGADWASYKQLYTSTNTFKDAFNAREEELFMFLLLGCKKIFNNFHFFIFVIFTLSFYLKYKVITKYSSDFFLSLIIYIYTLFMIYDLNGIRQGLAIAIVLLSITSIINRKFGIFIVHIIIAAFFHKTALIFLPLYWLSRIQISKQMSFLLLGFSIIFAVSIRTTVQNSSIIQTILSFDTFSHYSAYVENEHFSRSLSALGFGAIQRIFIFVLLLFNYEKIQIRDDLKRLLLNGYFISILIFIFLSFNAEFAARLSFYYKGLEILIIPLVVSSQPKFSNRLILLIVFVSFSLLGAYRILEIPNGGLIPYNNLLW